MSKVKHETEGKSDKLPLSIRDYFVLFSAAAIFCFSALHRDSETFGSRSRIQKDLPPEGTVRAAGCDRCKM